VDRATTGTATGTGGDGPTGIGAAAPRRHDTVTRPHVAAARLRARRSIATLKAVVIVDGAFG